MTLFLRRIAVMLMAVILSAGSAHAQVGARVGKVVALDGVSSDYVVRRQGRSVPITFNMALLTEDEIEVRIPKRSMKILYVDGTDDIITATNSPFRLKPRAAVTDPASNFRRALWQNVTKAHDDGLRTTAIRDRDRLTLDMPGLSDGTARIAAGDRHFMLQWNGGRGPYRVVVRDSRMQVILDEEDLPTRQLIISSRMIRFEPGRYTVEVSAEGQRVTGEFTAMTAGVPREEVLSGDAEGAVAAAEALAVADDRALIYEAYLRLYAGIRARYGLAQALGNYFAVGSP